MPINPKRLHTFGINRTAYISRYLRTGGSPNWGAAVGTLGTPVVYEYQVESGKTLALWRVLIHINDDVASGNDFTFGGQAALTNGLRLLENNPDDTQAKDFTKEAPIKRNFDWTILTGVDILVSNRAASNQSAVSVQWNLGETLGRPLLVAGDQKIALEVRDTMTQTTGHVRLFGYLKQDV